jgi:hypothetical protein
MSQHDLNIANQGFPAFRADLNDALVALGSTNSGATAPATTFANQLWYDTANNILKIRNEDNDAWISIVTLDQSGDVVSAITAATVNATTVNTGALNTTGNTVLGDASSDTLNVGAGGLVKDSSGNVGIDNASPSTRLDIVQSGAPSIIRNTTYRSVAGQSSFASRFARGTSSSPAIVQNGDTIGNLEFYPYNGTNFNLQTAQISALVTGTVTSSSIPTSILFNTDAAGAAYSFERMRINQFGAGLGGSIPSSGMGITFPATQSASSDANTLDDYEEGTWTPVISADTPPSSVSHSVQSGFYTKIGNVVYVRFRVTFGFSGGSGALRITGLPFTSASGVNPKAPVQHDNISYTGYTYVECGANGNSTYIGLGKNRSAAGSAGVQIGDCNTGYTDIVSGVFYYV